MDEDKRAMIVIGIFIICIGAILAFVALSNLPVPAQPIVNTSTIVQNATYIHNVTQVR